MAVVRETKSIEGAKMIARLMVTYVQYVVSISCNAAAAAGNGTWSVRVHVHTYMYIHILLIRGPTSLSSWTVQYIPLPCRHFQRMGDSTLALQFLVVSQCNKEAFEFAKVRAPFAWCSCTQ